MDILREISLLPLRHIRLTLQPLMPPCLLFGPLPAPLPTLPSPMLLQQISVFYQPVLLTSMQPARCKDLRFVLPETAFAAQEAAAALLIPAPPAKFLIMLQMEPRLPRLQHCLFHLPIPITSASGQARDYLPKQLLPEAAPLQPLPL